MGLTLKDACAIAGVDTCTYWHMQQEGLVSAERYKQRQANPVEIRKALPEFRWRKKYSGDFTPLNQCCRICGVGKPISDFRRFKSKSAKYGYNITKTCKKCEAIRDAKRRDPEREREAKRRWAARNQVKERARHAANRKDPRRALDRRVSKAIARAVGSGCKNGWRQRLPYTFEELKEHLEKQFLPGMGWHNIGEWHIDHIIPKSSFEYSHPEDPEFLACWDLCNLRPLWAEQNVKKGASIRFLI